MEINARPVDMLQRQLLANRLAAQKRKHFAHIKPYRPYFVWEMLALRAELRKRGARVYISVSDV